MAGEGFWRLAWNAYLDGDTDLAIKWADRMVREVPLTSDPVHVLGGRYWSARWRIFPDVQRDGPGLRAASPGGTAESRTGRRGAAPMAGSAGAGPGSTDSSAGVGAIRGRIVVAPELTKDVRSDSVLFLIARAGAGGAGPPLAVRRFSTPRFPLEFEIGPENVMIPSMRFEGAIQLTARLDSDGNAMTRLPGDLQGAMAAPLAPGAAGAVLTLDQKL